MKQSHANEETLHDILKTLKENRFEYEMSIRCPFIDNQTGKPHEYENNEFVLIFKPTRNNKEGQELNIVYNIHTLLQYKDDLSDVLKKPESILFLKDGERAKKEGSYYRMVNRIKRWIPLRAASNKKNDKATGGYTRRKRKYKNVTLRKRISKQIQRQKQSEPIVKINRPLPPTKNTRKMRKYKNKSLRK